MDSKLLRSLLFKGPVQKKTSLLVSSFPMLFDVSIVLLFAAGFLFHLIGMASMGYYPLRRRLPHPFTVVG